MPTYFIATSKVVDEELLAAYEAGAGATLGGHDIKLLAFTRDAKAIEGEPPGERVVMLEFPDEAAFRAWYESPAYQEVLPKRLGATEGFAVLVDGVG
jgi:uncharacterized protein (DUF1330 family)